ncbi:MAG: transferase [Thermodesulfobacteriota bacterium]|nr:transferase [Thermodesulfobacteriota bacterium]
MKELQRLLDRLIQRANINLREINYDATPVIQDLVPLRQMDRFYAFYGISNYHPLDLQFQHANLAGSYFLGKCRVASSLVYKSDVRGDELKKKGDVFKFQNFEIPITRDEGIDIEDSFLVKTLVHNFSHDPESLERFFIKDTISTHYANIHGSPCDGCFLGPFATADLTTLRDCIIGTFSYVQAGEISHMSIKPGTIWVRSPGAFNFFYQYDRSRLEKYIRYTTGSAPTGIFMEVAEACKEDFQNIFDRVHIEHPVAVPDTASVDRYALVKGDTHISDNVLVAQRAFLDNAWMGTGANAQENCYIVNSRLEGNNVTAHGAKILDAELGKNVFVGFNSFLNGRPKTKLKIGNGCIIMPHTIIDAEMPLAIPDDHLAWGMITGPADIQTNTISIKKFAAVSDHFSMGDLFFEGSGKAFVEAFEHRIHHILEANGAFCDGTCSLGHAQINQKISFNTLQPYSEGDLKGLFPTITIRP